ncbi:MAG: 23S rRNA (uracil(1939)-C(5))-methyltransferase RlmD [Fibrobacterota bacterium]
MKPTLHQRIELDVLRLGVNGEGVAEHDGYVLFVPGALPGERVAARVTETKKSYGRADLVNVIAPAEGRVEPACTLFGRCGGCQLMHLSYERQLTFKRERVADVLLRIGGLSGVPVEPCLPSERVHGYRNKVEVPFRLHKGKPAFGFYEVDSHDLVPLASCPVHCGMGNEIFSAINQAVLRTTVAPYNEQRPASGLRHLLIKSAPPRADGRAGEALVVFVTYGWEVTGLRRLARVAMKSHPGIKGVVQNNNPRPGNVILGPDCRTLLGEAVITEKVNGLEFEIGPLSFFQVNACQLSVLSDLVLQAAQLTGNETVLDAYCGSGFFSLFLARKARHVIGVESVPEAVNNARTNAGRNGIANVEFICGDAETLIRDLPCFDVAVFDPPRKGCEEGFLRAVAERTPQRIVYVSCNPASLARDLRFLVAQGYAVDRVQPVDLFPQTAHVECVVTLQRIKAG